MDKHRKAVVELCAAIELADNIDEYRYTTPIAGDVVIIGQKDWLILKKLVERTKASFNHSMQFHYEQHLARERDFRGIIAQAEPQKEGDQ